MSVRKTLEEKILNLEQKQFSWVEPMRKWINKAQNVEKIARDDNLFNKKVIAKEIFGSNLLLVNREARFREPSDSDSSLPNQWTAVSAAHQNFDGFSESHLMERVAGIGPATHSWEARVLPLNYTRTDACVDVLVTTSVARYHILRL